MASKKKVGVELDKEASNFLGNLLGNVGQVVGLIGQVGQGIKKVAETIEQGQSMKPTVEIDPFNPEKPVTIKVKRGKNHDAHTPVRAAENPPETEPARSGNARRPARRAR